MKPSGIITLTTDFGLADPYVSMMKGVILSIHPDARLVDITHQINTGSILQAACLIQETFPFFPKGTVHVAVVDPGVGSQRRPIALDAGGHVFVGPDNGVFWPLIQEHKGGRIIHLTENGFFLKRVSHTFHGREIFAPVAAHLSRGVDLVVMGPRIRDPFELPVPKPQRKGGVLYGQITRVDHFGNLITNIHRRDLDAFLQSDQPLIGVGNRVIQELSRAYADKEEGELLALINSSDWLEIAVNLGRASERIRFDPGGIIGAQVKVEKSEPL